MPTACIDVICPTHNASTGILPSLYGVLAQTVEDWNLIVVADGCTDETVDVVRSMDDPRIEVVSVDAHGSPGGPRNVGLATATSPHVAYLDHDDRWEPDHLRLLLEQLESGSSLAATGCVRVDSHGRVRERSGVLDTVWHPELQTLNAMYEPSRVGHVRSLASEVGGWSTTVAGFEDWDLWFRLAEHGAGFTMTAHRTAILTLSDSSRRHTFSPRRGIGIARLDGPEHAERIRTSLADPAVRARADECYVADTRGWFADILSSSDCIRSSDAGLDDLMDAVKDKVATGAAGSLLRELVVLPDPVHPVLALPTAPVAANHNRRIRELIQQRNRAQLQLLRTLLRP
ncbi:hypothetical protein GCM10009676_13390 [Prauserella halophila]|uniref:Glycosyltransferase 2-like domain-containing protein n=1 Tax=Prauserella halophila TaxID=185641 RepID=A0ABP4GQG9_9PSEU|nr:glycosyltransferase family 2 protein [Prauserella halophila]MCP2236445.1 Glycosyl transferase family 2 [Prauserella halophila]